MKKPGRPVNPKTLEAVALIRAGRSIRKASETAGVPQSTVRAYCAREGIKAKRHFEPYQLDHSFWEALARAEGNISTAAKILGVSKQAVHQRLAYFAAKCTRNVTPDEALSQTGAPQ